MPLPVAHALLGAGLVAAVHPRPSRRRFLPLAVGALLANAPDLDFLLVFAFHSRAWHRGFTHSLAFAFVVFALFCAALGRERLREAAAYGLAYASHGVLDLLTTKEGGGVQWWWPFSGERLVPGWLGLSEVPSRLPPSEVLRALAVELAIFAPALLAVLLLRRAVPRRGFKS